MAGQLIPLPEFAPPVPQNLTSEQWIALRSDLYDAGEKLLLAGLRLQIGPDGDLYFADTDNSVIRAIDLESLEIRTVVGTGEPGFDEEEGLPATETRLSRPFGLAFDGEGNLYVMDSLNSRIVRVKP